jgi:threonine aldolase
MEESSHTFLYEVAGAARLWSCQPRLFPSERGVPDPARLAALVRPENVHMPRTALCLVENTHNIHGGTVVPLAVMRTVRAALPDAVKIHLDGARIWNAHVATGTPLPEYAACADTVQVCLSKGLGCPVGSLVIADADVIGEARRLRKLLGGGMRQVGVLAAPALVALDEGLDHLDADHRRARRLAEAFGVDPATVDTNIVIATVVDAPTLEARLAEQGVRTIALSRSSAPERDDAYRLMIFSLRQKAERSFLHSRSAAP